MKLNPTALVLATILAAGPALAQQVHLRYGIADDADALDPALNRTSSAMIVLHAICDRLLTLDDKLDFKPMLATDWKWSPDNLVLTMNLRRGVVFQDGTPFNAEAVKYNIERSATMPESQRRNDTAMIAKVDVTGEHSIAVTMKAPDASQLAKFSDRIGMMVSPTAARAAGANFARNPVCAGPFKFVERVAQDRMVVDRFPDYWEKGSVFLDRITFRVIPDGTVRLANLQSGGLDLIERLDPTDADTVKRDSRLRLFPFDTLNYQSLVINVAGTPKGNHPMGRDPRVREAFDLALDRKAIVEVAFGGVYIAGNQFAAPNLPYYDNSIPIPPRDVEKARRILREAGYTQPVPFEIIVPNRPTSVRVAEMMQAMTSEAGFDTKLKVVEFATSLNMTDAGDFQAWGPIGPQNANDPDALTYMSLHSAGNRNVGKYQSPEMDRLMTATRTESDPAKRRQLFHQAAALIAKDRAVIYLYHQRLLFAASAKLQNLTAAGDGFVIYKGLKVN